jgi:uncharacterized protein DUF349
MDIKEQPNQNPETENKPEIQDEKSLTVSNDSVTEEQSEIEDAITETQISEIDKKDIIEMLASKISVEDKSEIEKTETPVEVVPEEDFVSEKETKQISDSEKDKIIMMLRGKPEPVDHDMLYVDIDFEHLNKQELVDIIEDVVKEKDISLIKSQVAKINSAFYHRNKEEIESELQNFITGGGKGEDFKHIEDPLEIRYNAAIGIYKHNKAKYSIDLEKQKQVNLQLKRDLLDDLKELVNSEETLKKTYDEFKRLQDRWKEIGMIPASELRNLWQSYHFLVEKFFDKVRINRELRDLDLKKNLESKVALCEKAEELIIEKSILKSFKLLQHYHDKWREIGPVPTDVKEDIWERFKGITDKINQRRKEYYKELQDQQQANYEAKLALCEKAKEIVSEPVDTLKGWQTTTDKMNELLKLWKTIGRAPKSKNDEVWSVFKGSLDSFFNSKREYLNELKEQQVNNYNLKLELCTKAEVIKDSSDWNNTTRELIKLQKEWKSIGPVPRKYSDKVWKRFRALCDEFFNRKSEHFKGMHAVEDENLKKKKEIVKEITEFEIQSDKTANLNALKDFQKRWIEIGYVPFKEKDKVQTEYRAAIDDLIGKMDVNKSELSASDFKDKLDILKSGPDAGKRISKEKSFISGKIRKINEDLSVWENNIGFFSNSKQSNKLKEEFEQKIEKAKSEIDSLKSRLKLMD